MAKYRTLEPVTYVEKAEVVSVSADREVDLTDDQALSLAGRVLLIESQVVSMFPDGHPIIDHVIVRTLPNTPVAGEPVAVPAPQRPVSKVVEKSTK